MTENKRFTVKKKDLKYARILENGKNFSGYFFIAQAEFICDKLNELSDENERLETYYNSLSHNNELLYNECNNKINSLKEEKEKLKQQRDFYYARLQKIIKVADGDWE